MQSQTKKQTKSISKQKLHEDSDRQVEPFAHGMSFRKMFFIFLIGSIIGSIYEEALFMITTWFETGAPEFALRRGVIYGPFNVIYGFGAVIMCLVLVAKPRSNLKIFLMSAVLDGLVEYFLSLGQELVTHTVSWNYADKFLNIGGRTTIPYMVVWGLLGLIFVKYVYPFFSDLIEKIPPKPGEMIFRVMLVFMVLDMAISWTAVIRQTLRHNHVPPFTPIGEFYDNYYNDEFLKHYYPNMEHHDLEND